MFSVKNDVGQGTIFYHRYKILKKRRWAKITIYTGGFRGGGGDVRPPPLKKTPKNPK